MTAVVFDLSPHAKALAARAGMIAQFWPVEVRMTAVDVLKWRSAEVS